MSDAASPRNALLRLPLSVRAAAYASATVWALTALQVWVLVPDRPLAWGVLLLPAPVCGLATFVITRAITRARSEALIRDFRGFREGTVDAQPSDVVDAEFLAARELFVKVAAELRDAERALARRDVERRRLFADVVHEIGTPVSSLLGLSAAIADRSIARTDEQRSRAIRAISDESERLARFVDDLREVAYLDDPDLKLSKVDVDLVAIATDVVERFRRRHPQIAIEADLEPLRVIGDPFRLEQVLVNLLTNATKYAPDGPVRLRVATAGACVVEDGGPGVPEEDLHLLGQRLRRLDPSRTRRTGGSGLGLSIVTTIVENHGGSIAYGRSTYGGLAVTLRIPVAGDAEPHDTSKRA